MGINLYDFDKTIYNGDSTIDFYLFILKKHKNIIKFLPNQIKGLIKYKQKKISKETFKEYFFEFLTSIENPELEVKEFWIKNKRKIKKWYLNCSHKNDIIISASPEFLVKEIGKILKVKCVIASEINIKNGKFKGKNCYGKEKVRRFKEKYPASNVINAYSDSLSDMPMLNLAKNKYLVNQNKIKKITNNID